MYSQAAISSLEQRIGFGKGFSSTTPIDEENQTGTSGRTLPYFHRLATPKNLYETVEEIDAGSEKFNEFLKQLKTDAVKAVLTDIMHKNKLYRNDFDYSDTIIDLPEIFDDPIGYAMAISAVELMLSSTRINSEERNAALSYQKLKIELEGARDNEGNVVAVGLTNKYRTSVKKAVKILFPDPIIIETVNYW